MKAVALAPLLAPLRLHGAALLAALQAPHDELLALVWGPRFDRVHALGLLQLLPRIAPGQLRALLYAADGYDSLPAPAQQRLRRLILRHRRQCENAACTASC
ncbi:MAG: hypothetical protein JWR60_3534 [Polaromonas sp.]|nr:hypothetical protein [Polaromonas sp.]